METRYAKHQCSNFTWLASDLEGTGLVSFQLLAPAVIGMSLQRKIRSNVELSRRIISELWILPSTNSLILIVEEIQSDSIQITKAWQL